MRLFAFLFLLLSAVTASAVAPSPPTDVVATATTNKRITISWVASSGATSYRVYRDGNTAPLTTTSSTSYTDSDPALVAGQSYSYRVSALNAALEESALSSPAATATPVNTPGVPSNLRATDLSPTTVTLAWNAVDGATSYTLYRDDEAVEEDIAGTTFQDTGLTLSTTYTYNVTANSSGGESAKSADLVVTTFGNGTDKEAVWAKRFRQIDIDADRFLTLEEYLDGHTARLAKVVGIHRFEYSDTDSSETLSLSEYAKSFGGRKFFSPSRPRQFYLADRYFDGEDADGFLDVYEFALTLGSKTKETKVENMFEKKDANNSGHLSEVEFGIRGGSEADYVPPVEP